MNTQHWSQSATFYHIYPLGFCDAPKYNGDHLPVIPRLDKVTTWIPHMKKCGFNALYLGPLFQSKSHGYDTSDYYHLDRRLGDDQTLEYLSHQLHENGIKIVVDGVFNHVGRDFWAFQDLCTHQQNSRYIHWFKDVNFQYRSPQGDPFSYHCWEGHSELVTLNLNNPEVQEHIFGAIKSWIEQFQIDGLRLDVAYALESNFIKSLRSLTQSIKPDFWLMGETIHGDYNQWLGAEKLQSTTNYECYKGLYSSHNDENYFEIGHTLNRQYGPSGCYQKQNLYNFVDNHDVDRVASRLNNPAHLYPLYGLLFTIPGIPSVYYGSEWGINGVKKGGNDAPLRPALELNQISDLPNKDLSETVEKLSKLRAQLPALQTGDYKQIYLNHKQIIFSRTSGDETVIIAVNSDDTPIDHTLSIPGGHHLVDLLNHRELLPVVNGSVSLTLNPCWIRVLKIMREY